MALNDQYKDNAELKKSREEHRLYSETVKLMYDDGLNLNISLPKKKAKLVDELDLSDPKNYFIQNGPALYDKLNDILEDVDLVHKVIKQCITEEELQKVED